MTRPALYIAIAGNIGAGKSSLASFLAERFDLDLVAEPNEDNPFLAPFYEDMPRWAFHSQAFFLGRKALLHADFATRTRPFVQDRTLWEDAEIFARHLASTRKMSPDEDRVYRMLYDALRPGLRPPDLMIRLRCPVATLTKRIEGRGRAMEKALPRSYLRALDKLYDTWFASYQLSPVVEFRTDHFDPLTNLVDQEELLHVVAASLGVPPAT